MVHLREVQGRIYNFKSKAKCAEQGISTVVSDVVRGHMVLVLDLVRGRAHHVKVMTVGIQIFAPHTSY